jgi:hypothetical protein
MVATFISDTAFPPHRLKKLEGCRGLWVNSKYLELMKEFLPFCERQSRLKNEGSFPTHEERLFGDVPKGLEISMDLFTHFIYEKCTLQQGQIEALKESMKISQERARKNNDKLFQVLNRLEKLERKQKENTRKISSIASIYFFAVGFLAFLAVIMSEFLSKNKIL